MPDWALSAAHLANGLAGGLLISQTNGLSLAATFLIMLLLFRLDKTGA